MSGGSPRRPPRRSTRRSSRYCRSASESRHNRAMAFTILGSLCIIARGWTPAGRLVAQFADAGNNWFSGCSLRLYPRSIGESIRSSQTIPRFPGFRDYGPTRPSAKAPGTRRLRALARVAGSGRPSRGPEAPRRSRACSHYGHIRVARPKPFSARRAGDGGSRTRRDCATQ